MSELFSMLIYDGLKSMTIFAGLIVLTSVLVTIASGMVLIIVMVSSLFSLGKNELPFQDKLPEIITASYILALVAIIGIVFFTPITIILWPFYNF